MKKADLKIEWIAEMKEYEYMKVKNGAIVEYTDFKPDWVRDFEREELLRPTKSYNAYTNYGSASLWEAGGW